MKVTACALVLLLLGGCEEGRFTGLDFSKMETECAAPSARSADTDAAAKQAVAGNSEMAN